MEDTLALCKKSYLPRIHPNWVLFSVVLLICWLLLLFCGPWRSNETVLRIAGVKVSAKISGVVQNKDGSVNVILRLEENIPPSVRHLGTVSEVNRSHELGEWKDSERRITVDIKRVITKTSYPLTLSSPYVINNPSICSGPSPITFLIIVHSAPGHFQRRRTLRETWANKNLFKTIQMRIVFLFGLASDKKTQILIENESTVYRDTVQGNFKDSYRNLTHKGVLGYRWISEHCNSSRLIIKVDDDVFVNIFSVIDNILPTYGKQPKQILCHVRKEGTSPILHGNTKLKWGVGEDDFRGQKFYPTYCNGYAVFLTPDLITGMYRAAYLTPFFWVDDVYLFGLLPKKIRGVHWENIVKNFTLNQKLGLESYEAVAPSKYIVSAAWQEGVMEKLWFAALSKMTRNNRKLINEQLAKAVDDMVLHTKRKPAAISQVKTVPKGAQNNNQVKKT